jgi:tRNA-dihydrouridine synthase
MKLDFAPMEGVTSYLYRNVHAACFPGVDRYYSPFIAPDGSGRFKGAALRDILPENNRDVRLVPQVLCSRAEAFLAVSRELAYMGYGEVNLNAGCPSGTVVPKHKGAGMLADLNSLHAFLAEVFSRCELKVSVKTRLGLESTAEFPAILEIYNKYPVSELIIHARDRAGMYKSTPDLAAFAAAFPASRAPVTYNGSVVDRASFEIVLSAAPGLGRVMLGRGAVTDPALFRVLQGGEALQLEELREFLSRLERAFLEAGLGEHYTISRLKEVWYYVIDKFPQAGRLHKAINKARRLEDYDAAVSALFSSGLYDPKAAFRGR